MQPSRQMPNQKKKNIHQNFKIEAHHPQKTTKSKSSQKFKTFTYNFNTQGQHTSSKKETPESKNLTFCKSEKREESPIHWCRVCIKKFLNKYAKKLNYCYSKTSVKKIKAKGKPKFRLIDKSSKKSKIKVKPNLVNRQIKWNKKIHNW